MSAPSIFDVILAPACSRTAWIDSCKCEPIPRSEDSMTDFPSKTLRSPGLSGELDGVGSLAGSAVDAPTKSLFSCHRIGVSGPTRKISGSGSVYGRSSIRRPSLRQSSNLFSVSEGLWIMCHKTHQCGSTIFTFNFFVWTKRALSESAVRSTKCVTI